MLEELKLSSMKQDKKMKNKGAKIRKETNPGIIYPNRKNRERKSVAKHMRKFSELKNMSCQRRTYQMPSLNKNRLTARHISVKRQKTEDRKIKLYKLPGRKKDQFKRPGIRMASEFSTITLEYKIQWNNTFKIMKANQF